MALGKLGGALPALPYRPKIRAFLGSLVVFFVIVCVFPRPQDFSYRLAQPDRPRPGPPGAANPEEEPTSPIPAKIWQIYLPKKGRHDDEGTAAAAIDPAVLRDTPSWLAMNPGAAYTLAGADWADRFVDKHYADDEPLRRTYHALRNPGLKSDLLRYLVLAREGGVYTDVDTVAVRPLDAWVPRPLRARVRLVVGLEYDRRDHKPWREFPYDVQFAQWTIAAAPGHPVLADVARRAVADLDALAAVHNTTLARVQPSDFEVVNATGPAAWTRVVFDHIRLADPDVTHLANLSYMTEPRLYGDILVLNIDGFGSGLPHSGATDGSSGLALAKHKFRGSWREVPW